MSTFITIIHILACLFLMLVVLLQSGRDGGMGAMGGGGSQTVFGGRGAGNFLTRLTGITAAIFMATSLTLSLIAAYHGGNLDSKIEEFNTEHLPQVDTPTTEEAPDFEEPTEPLSIPTSAPTSEPASTPATQAASAPTGPVDVALPSGPTLNVPAGSLEAQLVAFIQDPNAELSKEKWFDFDRLRFETGKSTLTPESTEQLKNLVEILKAYPKVKVKVGAYTDNTGDPITNKTLSQQRADSVKTELTKLGITADRINAEGYGDQHPVAPNDTEENRAKNRRISISVREK